MGLKLSRHIRKIRNIFLAKVKKNSFLTYKILILISSVIKFVYKKNKKISHKIFSNNLNQINEFEFKRTSQNNEDGIIQHVAQKLEIKRFNFVEIGFDFFENNSLNLLRQTNKGLFIDGSNEKVFLLKNIIKLLYPFKNIEVLNKLINKDNINNVIGNFFLKEDEIDFLSIDVDGIDYYIFENLMIRPKIICIEYNFWFGKDIKCSVPYNKNFFWEKGSVYSGTSLNALNSLANQKDYFLIALESNCVNAFFIRGDLKDNFKILDPQQDFKVPIKYSAQEIKSANKVLLDKKLTIFK